jgi:hypothetical protein
MTHTFTRRPALATALLIVATVLMAYHSPASAAGQSAKKTQALPCCPDCCALLQPYLSERRLPEFVEMLLAVATGSQMGPGEGWFHPAKSRYSWQWLASRHGIKPDGRISRKQFKGPPELFDRLDRNRDGFLSPGDFDWSPNAPYVFMSQMADMWFVRLDANSNGRVSRAEWDQFFKKTGRGKDYISREDLRAVLASGPLPFGPSKDGPTREVLFKGLLSGELGSFKEGPDVGKMAPDFTLPTHDGKANVRLSQFRGKKPVVLLFGNFT